MTEQTNGAKKKAAKRPRRAAAKAASSHRTTGWTALIQKGDDGKWQTLVAPKQDDKK